MNMNDPHLKKNNNTTVPRLFCSQVIAKTDGSMSWLIFRIGVIVTVHGIAGRKWLSAECWGLERHELPAKQCHSHRRKWTLTTTTHSYKCKECISPHPPLFCRPIKTESKGHTLTHSSNQKKFLWACWGDPLRCRAGSSAKVKGVLQEPASKAF